MSPETAFAELCHQVCSNHGWELLPTGVVVRWGDGRHQLISLEIFEFEREELVRLSTTIGDVEQLTREQLAMALETNAKLAHGALAIKNDQLCMIDTLLTSGTGADELSAAIEYLAREADEYERVIYGTDDH